MKDFTTTRHCRSRAHCNACRNDAAWRAAMARTFIMPETCPHEGKPRMEFPDDAADICDSCLRPGCPNVHRCCGGRLDLNLQVPCPDGRWQMIGA